MAQIPPGELEELKRTIPLSDLCRQRGIELVRHGSKDLKGICPFHGDQEASLIITPDKNLFNCFGCGTGGSNVDFVMKHDKVSFRHAVEILRSGVPSPGAAAKATPVRVEKTVPEIELDAGDHELMKQAIEYYHKTLLANAPALEYLEKRGINSLEVLKRFRIGYSNRTIGYQLPNKQLKRGLEVRKKLTKLGIYRESGHEHFNGCIVFPVFDANLHAVEIYGRKVIRNPKSGTKHLYLPGPHLGVWNSENVSCAREWILCESIIDALSFYVNGFENVTASYGVRGFSPDHVKLLKTAKVEKLLIAYDNDDAGNSAANELAQKLEAENIEAWRLELPADGDVNELVTGSEDGKAALASLLSNPVRLLPGEKPRPPVKKVPEKPPEAELPETSRKSGFECEDGQVTFTRGERSYRVRGLEKNTSFDYLKVNLKLGVSKAFHIDSFDLYNARQRTAFIAAACQVTGVEQSIIEEDFSILIPRIEEEQEKRIFNKLKVEDNTPVMTPEDEQKALALLRDPRLFDRLLSDFRTAGTVGEENNKLAGYLVTVSRKLDDPLSAVIMSRSAAGKSSLLNAILDFVPEEDKEVMTAMTAQALFYMPPDGLKHKVLAIAEDEGSEQACYPLKILQSEKVLVLAVTVKDQDSGTMQTQRKKVEGPVAQLMTSTQAELDYELANRYLVLTVDEGREQTRRIHEAQREAETLAGLLRKTERQEVLKVHHNAQRLLRPLHVVNPFARKLTFPDDKLRLRRDHKKYLALIRTVAFLRQYQKRIKSCEHRGKTIQYIEVDESDLLLAHPLAVRILGRCLDELAPPVRSFLLNLHDHVSKLAKEREVKVSQVRMTQRDIRAATGWSDTQVRRYLEQLIKLEYVIQHRVPGTGARYEYELFYDGQGRDGGAFLPFAEIGGLCPDENGTLPHSPPKINDSPPVRLPFAVGSP